jgi:hypothetical protein
MAAVMQETVGSDKMARCLSALAGQSEDKLWTMLSAKLDVTADQARELFPGLLPNGLRRITCLMLTVDGFADGNVATPLAGNRTLKQLGLALREQRATVDKIPDDKLVPTLATLLKGTPDAVRAKWPNASPADLRRLICHVHLFS